MRPRPASPVKGVEPAGRIGFAEVRARPRAAPLDSRAQGFHFSKAVDPARATELLRQGFIAKSGSPIEVREKLESQQA
jgi:hypothetical protein